MHKTPTLKRTAFLAAHPVIVAAVLALSPAAQAQTTPPAVPAYRLSLLPDNEGGRYYAASDINNSNQIVGTIGQSHQPQAIVWDLSRPGAQGYYPPFYAECCTYMASWGNAINDHGLVAGADTYRPALWNGAHRPALLAGEFYEGNAWDVNESHAVVGTLGTSATLWDASGRHTLTTLGGAYGDAYAINESGTIVGTSSVANSGVPSRAVVWQNGTLTDLGMGAARNLNDQGLVVGQLDHRAVLWSGTQATFLGGMGSEAYDINNHGWAVGGYVNEDTGDALRAMLWMGGRAIDLNSFLSQAQRDAGWSLASANAINDHGWIVGTAFQNGNVYGAPYVLSIPAVPEPASMALLAAGLGIVGMAARRRRAAGGPDASRPTTPHA